MTDLSLKSKPQTADTSTGDSPSDPRVNSGTDSGKITGDDDSVSDASNFSGNKQEERKDSSDALSLSLSASKNSSAPKLSRANMEEHDRQWAEIPVGSDRMHLDLPQQSLDEKSEHVAQTATSSTKRKKTRKSKKRIRALPNVSLSLDRLFPLPSPRQIELYLQAYDNVELDTRSTSPQTNSS